MLAIDKAEAGNYSENNDFLSDTSSHNGDREVEPLLKEFQFNQIAQWQAHKDIIKTVRFISETDIPIIFTAGMDRLAKIWTFQNDKVEPLGILR